MGKGIKREFSIVNKDGQNIQQKVVISYITRERQIK